MLIPPFQFHATSYHSLHVASQTDSTVELLFDHHHHLPLTFAFSSRIIKKGQDILLPVPPIAAASHLVSRELSAATPAPDRANVHSQVLSNFFTRHDLFSVPLIYSAYFISFVCSVTHDSAPFLLFLHRISKN